MMFWGVTLDPGKRYTQTVEKSFHLSMAALSFQNCSSTPVTVMVEEDKAQFALCTLQPGKLPQQPLDYCFTEGEEITFFTEGPGDVHLTGYLMDEPNALEFEDDEEELTADSEESESASVSNAESEDDESSSDQMTLGGLLQGGNIANDDDDDEDEESGDDDWDPSKDNPKRRKQTKKEKNKKTKSKTNDSKEHNDVTTSKDFEQAEEIPQSSEDDDDDDDNDDDDDDYEPKKNMKSKTKPKKKEGNKKKRKNQETEQETVENGVTQPQKLTKKAKKLHLKSPDDIGVENTENANALENNSESQNVLPTSVNSLNSLEKNSKKGKGKLLNQEELQQTKAEKKDNQSQATETTKRKLPGGTVLEEITKGSGKVAKKGQRVHVYYKGNLAKNKKQFDACLSGPPFSFRLGAGEVIRGWDLGVAGMQAGGKRRLTVPPSQGYGKKKMGPIPANSTLEFEIQLIRL